MGTTGFEPVTPAMSRQYSTAELRTQININLIILKLKKIYTNYNVLKKSLVFRKFDIFNYIFTETKFFVFKDFLAEKIIFSV